MLVSFLVFTWKVIFENRISAHCIYARFILGPVNHGYAMTYGICLRKLLLGIRGPCIRAVSIRNVYHELSSVYGIIESTQQILNHLKSIIIGNRNIKIKKKKKTIKVIKLHFRGPGILTSGDINLPYPFYMVDKKQYIATLCQDIKFDFFLCLELISNNKFSNPVRILPLATFLIDKQHYIIDNINYNVFFLESLKVEYLNIELWTNGSLTPSYALRLSAYMAWQFFYKIIQTVL